ncbi:hypothetical protein BJV78DRAFT_1279801 [Lactifluus subvellereus]|nr:hypothetical protein BJV78DRAFT_1279801 [Lactifluus subvellereus]
MSWLTRSSSTSSNTPPARISHSKASTIASIKHGNFGSGVTIVRTPQEALVGSGVSVEYASDQENENDQVEQGDEEKETRQDPAGQAASRAEQSDTPSVPPAYSPPRSSLPLSKSTPSLPLKDAHSTRSGRPAPPPASETPALLTQKKLPPPPLSTLFPAVPPLPAQLATPTSPPFECVLLSPIPPNAIDFSKVLVTLETCTATHRTTFNTLTSRPSHLANYLNALFSDIDEELDPDSVSLGSRAENGSFNSIFHNHLTASGLLSQSAYHVHIFLDRASPSYDHILAYLRSPPTSIDHVASLPHAVQLHAVTPGRLETLLALRDEAAYLDLPELMQLCTAELRRNPHPVSPPQHARTPSHVLSHTRGPSNASMRSMDTLRERDEDDAEAGSTSTGRDSTGSAQSLSSGSLRGRGHTRNAPSAAAAGAAPAKEKEDPAHPAPAALLRRRAGSSQSRERPEVIDVKPPTLRGRASNNWL